MTKFMWNGIKVNGKLYRAYYSSGSYINYPYNTITIYARTHEDFPKDLGLSVENNTEIQTDYFEKDRARITPGHSLYSEVHAAYLKQEEHNKKRHEKRLAKQGGK